MTQSELAEKLNYTDKSVSKWEHGDTTPPIEVLKALADIFEVTVDDLITDIPEGSYDRLYPDKSNLRNKIIITLLGVATILLVTTVLFVLGLIYEHTARWILYIYSLPITCIFLIVFNAIWGRRLYTFILVSILIWTSITCLYFTFLEYNLWALYICGAPLQIGTILWSNLKRRNKKR